MLIDKVKNNVIKKDLKVNYDVVIISCKAYDLDEAIADLKPSQKNAVIIPLLNGQAHINKLEKAFKKENVCPIRIWEKFFWSRVK